MRSVEFLFDKIPPYLHRQKPRYPHIGFIDCIRLFWKNQNKTVFAPYKQTHTVLTTYEIIGVQLWSRTNERISFYCEGKIVSILLFYTMGLILCINSINEQYYFFIYTTKYVICHTWCVSLSLVQAFDFQKNTFFCGWIGSSILFTCFSPPTAIINLHQILLKLKF